MHLTTLKIIFLTIASLSAAVIDTLAGGGGLITLPALLMVGLPPGIALGTNKLQACVGELNASIHFINHGKINFKELAIGGISTALGAIIGTILVQYINANFLNKLIPILLFIALCYSIFSKKFIEKKPKQRLPFLHFYLLFGLLIGFYGGFFGPGTGSFWVIAFMFFLGFGMKKATLYTKPLNFIGDFASLICFIIAGTVNYQVAFIMAAGQLVGSYIGAKLVIHKGAQIIRPVFITMVAIMMVSLLWKAYF